MDERRQRVTNKNGKGAIVDWYYMYLIRSRSVVSHIFCLAARSPTEMIACWLLVELSFCAFLFETYTELNFPNNVWMAACEFRAIQPNVLDFGKCYFSIYFFLLFVCVLPLLLLLLFASIQVLVYLRH